MIIIYLYFILISLLYTFLGWTTYAGLKDLGYNHWVVTHNNNFVNPNHYYDDDGEEVQLLFCKLDNII